jgi:hypothetical protein
MPLTLVLLLAILVALVALIVLFLTWSNWLTARQHWNFTADDVIHALENVLGLNNKDHDAFDLFLSRPIRDGYLDSVRQRARAVELSTTPIEKNPEGLRQMDVLLDEVRAHVQVSTRTPSRWMETALPRQDHIRRNSPV